MHIHLAAENFIADDDTAGRMDHARALRGCHSWSCKSREAGRSC